MVTVTGCCHPGILTLNSWARRNVEGYKPYGCYGGLHISLFETWDPKFDDIIKGVKAFKLHQGWLQPLHRLDLGGQGDAQAGDAGGEGHRQVQDLQAYIPPWPRPTMSF